MAQPLENTGAGDGARTRDLRRDRPNDSSVIAGEVGNPAAQEQAISGHDSQPTYAPSTPSPAPGWSLNKVDRDVHQILCGDQVAALALRTADNRWVLANVDGVRLRYITFRWSKSVMQFASRNPNTLKKRALSPTTEAGE